MTTEELFEKNQIFEGVTFERCEAAISLSNSIIHTIELLKLNLNNSEISNFWRLLQENINDYFDNRQNIVNLLKNY